MVKEVTLEIENKRGLHARPAGKLTQVAGKFQSSIFIQRDEHKVNAKSILGVLMLAAGMGTTLTVIAEGEDEEEAIETIEALFKSKFDEE